MIDRLDELLRDLIRPRITALAELTQPAVVPTAAHGVRMAHVLHPTRREYQKTGKTLSEAELSGVGVEVLPAGRRV